MGLDTTHNCWHGPYSSFGRFRGAILEAAGELPFVTPGGEEGYSYSIVGEYPIRCYYGWWDEDHPYTDALEVLIVHSDCEGWIFPQDTEPLADRLESFIERVDPKWQPRVRDFVTGLRKAANDWEIVGFH